MNQNDYDQFVDVLNSVSELYGKPALSEFAVSLWWKALESYELGEFQKGLSEHITNPDSGQFMPKPADVVKALGGTTADRAAIAWSKVDRAVRSVGGYQDVAFDDPAIHAAIVDMGGWIAVCSKSDQEWPFIQREFENRYRGFASRKGAFEYPPMLIGISTATNNVNRHEWRPELRNFTAKPVLIGNPKRAQNVISGGTESAGGLRITRLSDLSESAMMLLNNEKQVVN